MTRLRFDADGIEVEGGLLWLDAKRPKPFGVITHAHGDHVARHRRILCTPETRALVEQRHGTGAEYLVARYREPTRVGDLTVTLLSAGHILGSAMVLIEGPKGSVLYTGDVRLEGGLTCPPADPVRADVLITEATFGRSDQRHPPAAEERARLVQFARDALAAGETPVFLAYALGKGQEVVAALTQARLPVAAHGAVWKRSDIYRRFGHRFPGARRLSRGGGRACAVVVPPPFLGSVETGDRQRIAAVTGWGERVGQDTIQLSDHADYTGLIHLVETVSPKKVFVVHGYAKEFAADLRERGIDAEAVAGHAGPADDEIPGMFR